MLPVNKAGFTSMQPTQLHKAPILRRTLHLEFSALESPLKLLIIIYLNSYFISKQDKRIYTQGLNLIRIDSLLPSTLVRAKVGCRKGWNHGRR